jgi:hypothetical protein
MARTDKDRWVAGQTRASSGVRMGSSQETLENLSARTIVARLSLDAYDPSQHFAASINAIEIEAHNPARVADWGRPLRDAAQQGSWPSRITLPDSNGM